ncbi:MAG: helix-hairpin-helix domain-containing protein [Desulfurococcales archaeon]|nr:helix-hairpin-helix domain-containing protein [Desulfurococcales archaeon]
MKQNRIRIYADVRESRSGVIEELEKLGVLVLKKQLPLGDYLVSEEAVVERKTVKDFASSLVDGRLFDQASRLGEAYQDIYYIVEGSPRYLSRWGDEGHQTLAALVSLIVDYRAHVLWSEGPTTTAYLLYQLARRYQQERGGASIVVHRKPRLSTISEWQLYILQSFPGVGPKTARAILERFGSLERFCTSPLSELSSVEGLGERRAEKIKAILVTPYKPQKKRRGSLEEFLNDRGGEKQ